MTVHTCMELSYFDNVMLKHFKWLGLFFWELRVVLKVRVGVKLLYNNYCNLFIQQKNMGTCISSSMAQLVESRMQKPMCMGSNHGVDNRLVELAREKILIE